MKTLKYDSNSTFQIPKNLKEILNTTSHRYFDTYQLVKSDFKDKMQKDLRNNIHFYDIQQAEGSKKKISSFRSIHRFREMKEKNKIDLKKQPFVKTMRSFENSLRVEIKKEEKNLLFLSEM